jgi:putative endonuclease
MHQMPDIGELGEQLVAGWLQTQDWVILHHRWRCRWGEIDLIAQRDTRDKGQERRKWREGENSLPNLETNHPLNSSLTHSPLLTFVEVKTRSRGNWDADGLLAITPQKQAKLWRTAQLFLAEYPDLANFPARFDVGLVSCQRLSQRSCHDDMTFFPSSAVTDKAIQIIPPVQLGQPLLVAGYRLILQDYIQSAFD